MHFNIALKSARNRPLQALDRGSEAVTLPPLVIFIASESVKKNNNIY